jgi:outer membrane lipoprotein carrier protein
MSTSTPKPRRSTIHRSLTAVLAGTFALAGAVALPAGMPRAHAERRAASGTGARPSEGHALEASPDARTVAALVQRFHDQTRSVEARFYQTYYHRLHGRYQRSKGRLSIEKPGKLRFDYAAPNGKVIASDGRTLSVYDPGGESERGQYMEQPVAGATLPRAFSFLTGTGRLERDFSFRLLDADAWRFDGHILELRPKRPDPRYRRVILFVDARPGFRGVVHGLRIDDHEGNRNKLELSRLRYNRPMDDGRFSFRAPRGARHVRM